MKLGEGQVFLLEAVDFLDDRSVVW